MQRAIFGGLAALGILAMTGAAPADSVEGRTFGVSMSDYAFQPDRLTVRPGDLVVFVQKGDMPHNVEFRKIPKGVDLGETRMGPFVVVKGDTYQIHIDARFKPGVYEIVCTPHELMGMTARIVVEPAG